MTIKVLAVAACLLGVAVFYAYAQPVTQPRLGAGRDPQGRWRAIGGMAGTLLTGPALFENVVAGASNGSRHIVQTSTDLLVSDADGMVLARQPLSDGPAILAISSKGDFALAFLSSTSELLSWSEGHSEWTRSPIAVRGAVLAIATDGVVASLIVRQEDRWSRLTVDLASQAVTAEQALPALSDVVQIAANGNILWVDGGYLHQLDTAGSETLAPLPWPAIRLSALGVNWWHVAGENGGTGAVRCQGAQIDWFELPPGADR